VRTITTGGKEDVSRKGKTGSKTIAKKTPEALAKKIKGKRGKGNTFNGDLFQKREGDEGLVVWKRRRKGLRGTAKKAELLRVGAQTQNP